jgi:hypothetical protein
VTTTTTGADAGKRKNVRSIRSGNNSDRTVRVEKGLCPVRGGAKPRHHTNVRRLGS